MFAQIIRFTLKPNAWDRLIELDRRWEQEQAPQAPGFKGSYLLREQDPNRCTMVALFENRELAQQNSNRPDTNRWYQATLELIEGQPEFIDTEVVRSYLQ